MLLQVFYNFLYVQKRGKTKGTYVFVVFLLGPRCFGPLTNGVVVSVAFDETPPVE